jgi:hypothetical protein
MFRNYDGVKGSFGDISVSTSAPDPDTIAAFGAIRASDRALTLVLISKYLTGNTTVTVNISNFTTSGNAQRWELASNTITHPANVTVTASSLALTLPPQSVTTLVIPGTTDVAAPAINALPPMKAGSSNLLSFSGTASDDVGVTAVTWRFNGTAGSGTATGTTSWSQGPLAIPTAATGIVFTARDAAGNSTSQFIPLKAGTSLPSEPGHGPRRAVHH